jgi:alanyl-tRNA synthetase
MMTELLYFDDPLCLEFEAHVIEIASSPAGRPAVILPRTYFYPTGGGQEHDTGTIGPAQVLEVYKAEDGRIVHVLDRPLAVGTYPARLDGERRLRHMQHHTAQHLLSAVLLRLFDLESVSVNINGYTPSTVDLAVGEAPADVLRRAEDEVNRIIFENRPVKTYFVDEAGVAALPLRKPPRVSEQIRIVEIEGYDYTPCGGTHCLSTGSIGLLKIVRTERVNQKLRIHFVAGLQALDYLRSLQAVSAEAAALLETGWEEIPRALRRKLDQFNAAQSELEALRTGLLAGEAAQLADSALQVGGWRLVTAVFTRRPPGELRLLASYLSRLPAVVALLASHDGQKLSLICACAADTGLDARQLLQKHLAPLHLRGGGDATLAQGGGVVDETAVAGLFRQTPQWLLGRDSA